ncbi:MAG: hypothetical protein QG614_389 [Patescibacteria group bacterium]|nr:hypothetical protein [Patescibacteria group bacterium]
MLICELLPLKTTKKITSLTYFTSLDVEIGDLVEINMNGQILQAIIVNQSSIKDSKQEIRAKNFKIKKISKITNKNYIDRNLLVEIYNISTLLATTLNNIFDTLIPVDILNQIKFAKRDVDPRHPNDSLNYNIDETFYIFPTNLELRKFKNKNPSQKNLCSTPSFEFLLYPNIKKIIIGNESSKYYYSNFKNLDTKKALVYICKILNIDVQFEYNLPSLELYKNVFLPNNKTLTELSLNHKEVEIIKMDKRIYLNKNLENIITTSYKSNLNSKILLYTTRLGSYTQNICADCSTPISCKKCNKPYILMETPEGNYYKCSVCKDKIKIITETKCENCGGWNIKALGIGTEGIWTYLQDLLKGELKIDNVKIENIIHNINSEKTNTAPKVEKTLNDFMMKSGLDIMIATEQILPALHEDIFDHVFIVSMDSLFYINDYNIDERVFFIVNGLKSSLKKTKSSNIYLQTRMSQKFIDTNLRRITSSDLDQFYIRELQNREKNNLPPYCNILTYEALNNMQVPSFLKDYKTLKIPINYNTTRFVFFIPSEAWSQDSKLRELCTENLFQFNLKINNKEIF